MTLDEMKLAVCEKLPELVNTMPLSTLMLWRKRGIERNVEINWPTEGLQVCHEAECLLTDYEDIQEYKRRIGFDVGATYEQRLEALCRVWFPEKFP